MYVFVCACVCVCAYVCVCVCAHIHEIGWALCVAYPFSITGVCFWLCIIVKVLVPVLLVTAVWGCVHTVCCNHNNNVHLSCAHQCPG